MNVQDNGGRRPPKENNRNANGFGSTDIREKAKNGDKVNIKEVVNLAAPYFVFENSCNFQRATFIF